MAEEFRALVGFRVSRVIQGIVKILTRSSRIYVDERQTWIVQTSLPRNSARPVSLILTWSYSCIGTLVLVSLRISRKHAFGNHR